MDCNYVDGYFGVPCGLNPDAMEELAGMLHTLEFAAMIHYSLRDPILSEDEPPSASAASDPFLSEVASHPGGSILLGGPGDEAFVAPDVVLNDDVHDAGLPQALREPEVVNINNCLKLSPIDAVTEALSSPIALTGIRTLPALPPAPASSYSPEPPVEDQQPQNALGLGGTWSGALPTSSLLRVLPAAGFLGYPTPVHSPTFAPSSPSDTVRDSSDNIPGPSRLPATPSPPTASPGPSTSSRPDMRAQRRKAPYPTPRPSPASLTSALSTPSTSPLSSSPARPRSADIIIARRRNVQINPASLPLSPSSPSFPSFFFSSPPLPPSSGTQNAPNPWKCPHCEYVQENKRKPDFERHKATHFGTAEERVLEWVCCGVPHRLAARYGLAVAQLESDPRRAMEYAGERMLGGCRVAFSRRDALKRHLGRKNGRCVGDIDGPWLLGKTSGRGR